MRIVSLLASATEMIAELGCLNSLVGRSHECDYPPEVQRLPLVSTVQIDITARSADIDAQIRRLAQREDRVLEDALKALSIYAIDTNLLRQLQPDIVFTQMQCEVCAVSERDVLHALEQVTELHPRIISLAPSRLNDVWEDMIRVGEALKKRTEAEQLVQGYRQRLQQLRARTAPFTKQQGKPRVVVLEWLDPLIVSGNWTPELVETAGGESVCAEAGIHSPRLTWEALQVADPDVLILSPCGFSLERTLVDVPYLQRHPVWQRLQAVQKERIYAIDGNAYLNRSGPRLVESAELLARAIWNGRLGIPGDENGWLHIH